MGRRPRILLAGGIYHVYNRVSRGEHVFGDEGEVDRFEALLAETKKRDDFQILAWCVMSNHYLCAAAHKTCYVEHAVMWSSPYPKQESCGERCRSS
jgi:REP element-mobilizing transposase RayT